ncbi:MAG TPA: putative molybdenum carrier protein [Draconibacterium sp.]|nr:putative molybdenum carrier protein [Draconibacterium sp.]
MLQNKLQILCQKFISGGQTGVDRAVLDACLHFSFPCGGWCPKGRKAEDGVIPDKYPLTETAQTNYAFRTLKNILNSDGTLILAPGTLSNGTLLTLLFAQKMKKPVRIIGPDTPPDCLSAWMMVNKMSTLNIAGPRQSEWPEAYQITYAFTSELIKFIKLSASDILS